MSLSHLLIPLVAHLFQGDTGETGEPGPQGEVGPPVSYLSLFHFISIKKNNKEFIYNVMTKKKIVFIFHRPFSLCYTLATLNSRLYKQLRW